VRYGAFFPVEVGENSGIMIAWRSASV